MQAAALRVLPFMALCLTIRSAADSAIHRHQNLCFSGVRIPLVRSNFQNLCQVSRVNSPLSLNLRMTKEAEPIKKRGYFMSQTSKLLGIIAAGVSAFSVPRPVTAASHYEGSEPVIVLPSQEQHARRVAILNDKDYENPVMKIVKDKRVWAGAGACTGLCHFAFLTGPRSEGSNSSHEANTFGCFTEFDRIPCFPK